MLNLSLRQLRYFDALARHRHFGRAAQSCAISQPAMSEQIKELESAFGAQLFERSARAVRVTALGEALAQRVRAILADIDELDALAASHQPLKRLRLGVIPTVAPYLLPAVLRDLGAAFPDLELRVRETITTRLIEELAQGRLDAAIVALPVGTRAFATAALFTEEFVAVRPAVLKGTPPPCVESLAQERLLLLEEGHCFRDQALAFCGPDPRAQPRGVGGKLALDAGADGSGGARGHADPGNGGRRGSEGGGGRRNPLFRAEAVANRRHDLAAQFALSAQLREVGEVVRRAGVACLSGASN